MSDPLYLASLIEELKNGDTERVNTLLVRTYDMAIETEADITSEIDDAETDLIMVIGWKHREDDDD